jgi:hypothetical protein
LEQVATAMNVLIMDMFTRWNSRYRDLSGCIAYWQERNEASYRSRRKKRQPADSP